MKEFLKKAKLIDYLTTEVPIERNLFVSRFEQQVDRGSTVPFADIFEVFSSGKNEYKGQVNHEGFKIKKRRKLFDMNVSSAVATGTFQSKNDALIISTEINGFHGMMIPLYIFVTIFYLIFIIEFSFANSQGDENSLMFLVIPFLIIHAAFMYGIPYFLMRRNTSRMKRELEREFFYVTKEV